jgi:hypothetical protein
MANKRFPKGEIPPGYDKSLALYRHNIAKSKQCEAIARGSGERCKQPAVTGGTTCRHHGGRKRAVKRRREHGLPTISRGRLRKARVWRAIKSGQLDLELMRHPMFQEAFKAIDEGYARDGRFLFRQACYEILFEMIRGWYLIRDQNDHGPWAEVIRKGRELGLTA